MRPPIDHTLYSILVVVGVVCAEAGWLIGNTWLGLSALLLVASVVGSLFVPEKRYRWSR